MGHLKRKSARIASKQVLEGRERRREPDKLGDRPRKTGLPGDTHSGNGGHVPLVTWGWGGECVTGSRGRAALTGREAPAGHELTLSDLHRQNRPTPRGRAVATPQRPPARRSSASSVPASFALRRRPAQRGSRASLPACNRALLWQRSCPSDVAAARPSVAGVHGTGSLG